MARKTSKPAKAAKEQQKASGAFSEMLLRLGAMLLKNWPVKLLALVLAVILWAALITQDPTLTREKVFTDVPLSVNGADVMKRSGYVVVSDMSSLPTVTLRANVPQLQYNDAAASAYNARVDLTRIREAGIQTVKLSVNNSAMYGSVIDIYPDTVEIEVQEYITRYRIPVSLVTTGTLPRGYYAASATLDPPLVAVSGPRSLVESVYRAEATLDLSALPRRDGVIRSAVPFKLYTSSGAEIDASLLEVTSESVLLDSVIVEQTLYPTRELNVESLGLVRGTPADGYEVRSVTVTPASITAAGRAENLSLLDDLYADTTVDVNGVNASFTCQVKVRKPSELTWLSTDSVTVAVEIAPIQTEKTFSDLSVSLRNTPAGMSAKAAPTRASITITGEKNWLNTLRSASINLFCDLTGLEAGTHSVPVQCTIIGTDGHQYTTELHQAELIVTLTAR